MENRGGKSYHVNDEGSRVVFNNTISERVSGDHLHLVPYPLSINVGSQEGSFHLPWELKGNGSNMSSCCAWLGDR